MRISIRGTALTALLPLLVAAAQAGELALDQVPKPILDAVQARFADAKVMGAAKEKSPEGKEIYEINMVDKSQNNVDVTLEPEGAITLIEQQISRKELPEAVTKSLESKYPKARYRLIEAVIHVENKEEKLAHYEVLLITQQKQIRAVEVAVDGKVLKEEKKTAEQEED